MQLHVNSETVIMTNMHPVINKNCDADLQKGYRSYTRIKFFSFNDMHAMYVANSAQV